MRIFCQTISWHLNPTIVKWKKNGYGAYFDDIWLPLLGFADDVTLVSKNFGHLKCMASDVISVFQKIGLQLSDST
eukprot:10938872-Karenia_brevis.AAC.1